MKNYFYDLPIELQLHILSFIPRFRDVPARRKRLYLKAHAS